MVQEHFTKGSTLVLGRFVFAIAYQIGLAAAEASAQQRIARKIICRIELQIDWARRGGRSWSRRVSVQFYRSVGEGVCVCAPPPPPHSHTATATDANAL